MDLRLKEKVILVTGGAKGIGAAIVRASAAEGAIPVFLDRDAQAGQQLQAVLQSSGVKGEFVAGEITAPQTCGKTVEYVLQKFGRLDALVNNVGANDNVGLERGTPEKFVASLELNLVHYYAMAHYALPAPNGNSRQRSGACGSDDSTLPTVGFWIPKSGGEAGEDRFKNSSRKTHDKAGRDCRHGGVPDFGKSQPHHRTAHIRGRGLYPSGSSADVTETSM